MRTIISLALLLTVAVFAGENKEKAKTAKGHTMISVPSIQCDHCVKTIEKAVKKLDGVESIHIDLDKKKAHVNFDEKKVKVNDIEKAIAAAGYHANKVKRDEKAHKALMNCCQSPW